jgi:transposase-like protein
MSVHTAFNVRLNSSGIERKKARTVSFKRSGRAAITDNSPFTSENALFKLVYCACQKPAEKWIVPLQNWALTISQLDVYFEGRLKLEINN